MPDTNHFTGLPVPLDGEASNGPEDFAAFRAALAGHTVLYATTESNRNALYADAPVGTLCSSTTSRTVWIKTALPNTWDVLYYDSGWVSLSGASWHTENGWTDNGSAYRVVNGLVQLDLRITYNGDDVTPAATGQVDNIAIINLPSTIQPKRSGAHVILPFEYGSAYGTCVAYQSTGNLSLATLQPSTTMPSGVAVQVSGTYNCNG